jgi:hypothetical protein
MTARPLRCPRCRSRAAVFETTVGTLDWGLAEIDEHGIVRPVTFMDPPYINCENSGITTPYGSCGDPDCRHQWRLRRRFDPTLPDPNGIR